MSVGKLSFLRTTPRNQGQLGLPFQVLEIHTLELGQSRISPSCRTRHSTPLFSHTCKNLHLAHCTRSTKAKPQDSLALCTATSQSIQFREKTPILYLRPTDDENFEERWRVYSLTLVQDVRAHVSPSALLTPFDARELCFVAFELHR